MNKNIFYQNHGKRIFDLMLASLIFLPILIICIPFLFKVWVYDYSNPLYFATRVGKKMKRFKLIKIRSMVINADKSDIISTKSNDLRITKIGSIIRKYKIDELPQVLNIFFNQMSFVGPRPNTYKYGVELYTKKELNQLDILPGITDLSSIIFSDESSILSNSENPDKDYNELIRPWKSKLGLLYKNNCSFTLDIKIIGLTAMNILNRKLALKFINKILLKFTNDQELISVCLRKQQLYESQPPY